MAERFDGVMGRTIDESRPAWPPPVRAGAGAPNILYWVIDDTGFGQLAPFGGLIEMPTLQRLVDAGVQYTNFHTTALCSPTRSCLLTGRNHHSNHMGSITECATGYPGSDGHIRPARHPLRGIRRRADTVREARRAAATGTRGRP